MLEFIAFDLSFDLLKINGAAFAAARGTTGLRLEAFIDQPPNVKDGRQKCEDHNNLLNHKGKINHSILLTHVPGQ